MILNKRILRDFKNKPLKYSVLFVIVVLAVSVVVGMAGSTDSINYTIDKFQENNNVEDGEFSVYTPLDSAQISKVNEIGFDVEEQYFLDIPYSDSELRIFKFREDINTISIVEGENSNSDNEIIIEQKFAQENGYAVGDSIKIGEQEYKICGIGCVPDYTYTLKNITDVGVDNNEFGLVFVSDTAFDNISSSFKQRVNYQYAFTNTDNNDSSELKDYLMELTCDEDVVTDTYLKNLYAEASDLKEERDSSIDSLVDGSVELSQGIEEVEKGANNLADGLDKTNQALSSLVSEELQGVLNSQLEGSKEIAKRAKELEEYSSKLTDGIKELSDSYVELTEDSLDVQAVNLYSFLDSDNNKRIHAAQDDAAVNKMSALFSGVIVFLLIAFMFSVFAIHSVEENREVVGTLYAMGYKRKEIVKHFITLPVIIVLIGSIIGMVMGYFLVYLFASGNAQLYSYPTISINQQWYLYAYGLLMPNLLTLVVNYIILNKKLNLKPLELLRKQINVSNVSTLKLNKLSFINRFRMRHNLREIRTTVIMFVGMGIAILLMVWGFSIHGGLYEYAEKIEHDIPNEYTYILTNPLEEVPTDSEVAYTVSAQTEFELIDSSMEVTIMGISNDSEYYDFADKLPIDCNYAIISDAASKKFGYQVGDTVVLYDEFSDKNYCVTISEIVEYSSGLYFFMDINALQEITNVDEDYYNTLLSDKELDIDDNMMLSCITRDEIANVGKVLLDSMISMVTVMIAMSIILFCCVMYLLMKMMIDKSTFSISLLKIFGYKNNEVKKVYLNTSFYIVIVSIFFWIPISQIIVNLIFPNTVSDVTAYIRAFVYPQTYLLIALLILISYFIVYVFLYKKISKLSFVEVLKQRE